MQAKFYDAIFGTESRIAWLLGDEGTVAAVLGNDEFDAGVLTDRRIWIVYKNFIEEEIYLRPEGGYGHQFAFVISPLSCLYCHPLPCFV